MKCLFLCMFVALWRNLTPHRNSSVNIRRIILTEIETESRGTGKQRKVPICACVSACACVCLLVVLRRNLSVHRKKKGLNIVLMYEES